MQTSLFDTPAPVVDPASPFRHGATIIRHSEPMRTRLYEWRLTLYRSDHYARPLIGYEWRRTDGKDIQRGNARIGYYSLPGETWMQDEDWPRYDSDNGATAGLPAVTWKLYQANEWADARRWIRQIATFPTVDLLRFSEGLFSIKRVQRMDLPVAEYDGFWWVREAAPGKTPVDPAYSLHGPYPDRIAMAEALEAFRPNYAYFGTH